MYQSTDRCVYQSTAFQFIESFLKTFYVMYIMIGTHPYIDWYVCRTSSGMYNGKYEPGCVYECGCIIQVLSMLMLIFMHSITHTLGQPQL